MKIARECPVPKVGHAKDATEFRPISILYILSKVFERVILHQLCYFLEVKAQTQSGFRKRHSTTTLLLKFRDNIKRAMNTSEVTLGILLEDSKAFDTIDQLTLLEKLHMLNFSVQASKLIHSYVSERKQFVQVDDKSSSDKLNNFGVPQGSILGPDLFNLHIINLVENVICESLQYACDFTLYKHSKPKNLKKCMKELDSDQETVSPWSSNNSLVFNDNKTKLMLFSTTQLSQRNNLNNNKLFKVMHNGEAIERVNTKKIFGINFDKILSWSYHVNNVIESSYATLRSLRQLKCFTPDKVRKSLAETFIISKIRYCLVVHSQQSIIFNDYKKLKTGLLAMY